MQLHALYCMSVVWTKCAVQHDMMYKFLVVGQRGVS